MFRNFSIEELALIAILLEEETQCQDKKDETEGQYEQCETEFQDEQDEKECQDKQGEKERQDKQDEKECQHKQGEKECQDKQDVTQCQENKKRRFAVNPKNKKRKTEGEFFTLYKELVNDEDRFLKYFRMSHNEFELLLSKIKPVITKQNTIFKECITPREKLAVCLRFLATGDSYLSISHSYRLGVSTVHNIVTEVCTAILQEMTKEVMPTPTKEDWLKISEGCWNAWNFPNCIGALHGKHITVTSPVKSESLNLNYNKKFSIVIMAIVDSNCRFICVDVGAYGDISDGVFSNSNFGKALAANAFNAPEEKCLPGTEILVPHIIVGEEAFPLKTYLMRPYPKPKVHDPRKNKFNDRLSKARKVAENAFEQLTQKFRLYKRRIQLKPENAHKVLMTTCILHNFVKYNHVHAGESANDHKLKVLPRPSGKWQNAAINVRDKFTTFFDSPAGAM